ncbi:type II secretion system minor pseudopilin GspH [Escherichia coli]
MFIPWEQMVRKTGRALAQISVTGICRSFSNQCLNADSHFWKFFLIGLASAGVVQTFATASEPPAKKAAQDFLTRFAQFKDRAVIEGQTLGVLIDPPGYQFMQRRHGQWLPVSATRLSAQVTVPKQVQMLLQPGSDIWQKEYALELQRRRLTLHDIELELQKEAKKKTPQIRFSPFEPATPFTLRFYASAQNACWAVKLAHDGVLSLNQCDEGMP